MGRLLTRISRPPVVLALLALALYLPGFWWGAPYATAPDRTHAWGVDDETPLGPLGEINHIITRSPGKNLGYPLMYSFVVAAADAPYLAYLHLTGLVKGISAIYPFGLADAVGSLQVLTWIAHLVSVLMGVGIVISAYDAATTLWGRRTGILTALLAMLSYPMFYYSRVGNVDVPVLFFSAVALDAFAHIIRRGFTVRRAAWLGVFVGLAMATKESGLALFLPIPFVVMAMQWRDPESKGSWVSPVFWKAPLAALLACILAFGFGSGLFVDPQRYVAHVEFGRERLAEVASGNIFYFPYFPATWQGNMQLSQLITADLVVNMTSVGLLLAVTGTVWSLKRERFAFAFGLTAFSYLLVLFFSARAAQLRYLMPTTFVLTFFSARALILGWESRWRAVRVAALALALGIIGVSLLRGIDLTYAMINDSRYAAAMWLESHSQPGIHIEYFGYTDHLPPLPMGVITTPAVRFLGVTQRPRLDQTAFQEVRNGWLERKPRFVIMLPDLMSQPGAPYSGACPPAVYAALLDGTLGYHLAAYFQTPSLFPWLTRPALDYPVVNPPIRIFERESMDPST
jgi:hypothetical protein